MGGVNHVRAVGGEEILVDSSDIPLLSRFSWRVDANGYAFTTIEGELKFMHRVLVRPKPGLQVDHINGHKLDNRRGNLRACTRRENLCNRGPYDTGKRASPYKGVRKRGNRWSSQITCYGKNIYLGMHGTAEDAARAYDLKASELFGEFARLNFPGP